MGIQSKQTEDLKSPNLCTNVVTPKTFKMFDEAQIKEFKEIFSMIDKNADGVLQVDDLVALYSEDMGKPADEAALGAMIAAAPSTSRCSSSFSVRRCPAPIPRRPSWPAGICSTPPLPARWESTLSRTFSAPVVSRPTVSPRLRSPRCSTRSNPLVANSTTANSPASRSAVPTSRFSLRRLATTTHNRKHKQTFHQRSHLLYCHLISHDDLNQSDKDTFYITDTRI